MVNNTKRLLQAKFKGVSFFIRSESIDQLGQKRIVHDYPSSSARYVEAQGQVPPEFTLDIFFHGATYVDDFNAFKQAIEDEDPGRLFLPTFGIVNNVVAMPSSAASSQSEIGEIKLSVKFSVTIKRPAPLTITATAEDINNLGSQATAKLQTNMAAAYIAAATVASIQTVTSDLTLMSGGLNVLANQGINLLTFNNSLTAAIQSGSSLAVVLLSQTNPIGFLQNVMLGITSINDYVIFATIGNNLSNSINDITSNINPAPSSVSGIPLPTINTNINLWPNITTDQKARNQNRLLMVNTFRIAGIIGMMQAVANQSYQTIIDVTNARNTLNNTYAAVIENDTTGVLIPGIKSQLDQMKGQTLDLLNKQSQNVYGVTTLLINKYNPISLLSYDLYGEYLQSESQLNNIKAIIKGLNSSFPAHLLNGSLTVVTI